MPLKKKQRSQADQDLFLLFRSLSVFALLLSLAIIGYWTLPPTGSHEILTDIFCEKEEVISQVVYEDHTYFHCESEDGTQRNVTDPVWLWILATAMPYVLTGIGLGVYAHRFRVGDQSEKQ